MIDPGWEIFRVSDGKSMLKSKDPQEVKDELERLEEEAKDEGLHSGIPVGCYGVHGDAVALGLATSKMTEEILGEASE